MAPAQSLYPKPLSSEAAEAEGQAPAGGSTRLSDSKEETHVLFGSPVPVPRSPDRLRVGAGARGRPNPQADLLAC